MLKGAKGISVPQGSFHAYEGELVRRRPAAVLNRRCGISHFISAGRGSPSEEWDYEFTSPLFLEILNVKTARVSRQEIAEGKQESRKLREAFISVQRMMKKTIPYGSRAEPNCYINDHIEKRLKLQVMKVERRLDLLPSKTANILRLDRFSSRYTDKLHGNSP